MLEELWASQTIQWSSKCDCKTYKESEGASVQSIKTTKTTSSRVSLSLPSASVLLLQVMSTRLPRESIHHPSSALERFLM